MKLESIRVSGFKAIDRFSLRLEPNLTMLLGMNGAGKSSTLQLFSFIHHLAEGKPSRFFEERGWNPKEMKFRSSASRSSLVKIDATFVSKIWGKIRWQISWGLNTGHLRSERVTLYQEDEDNWNDQLRFDYKKGGIAGRQELPALRFEGSILTAIEGKSSDEEANGVLSELIAWLRCVQSLELLSPTAMKAGTRISPENMGPRGERVAGFLASLSIKQRARVQNRVGQFYPLDQMETVRKRAGWIDLILSERFKDFGSIQAAQMSDGFMRILAFCALPELPDVSLVLLDEVEDGIQPHILGRLIELILSETKAQIIATTHSPVLANVVGTQRLRLLIRDQDGRTAAVEAGRMPAFNDGSEFFGPGELWINTELKVLEKQARKLSEQDSQMSEDDED
ncbi:hypothetical protein AD933_10555 [Acetobacter malorum]|uniref:ATPase AAA-type core domain-containing protein n=1 Tax=Acetobacter malorum TaxID=178901 RepID=A0A149RL55_9PROT|nr:AAA family ATPase [Acetobacter malorum]KXV14809.1 hypothetical protein AD933_10555 [Acetobacter malorum]